MRALVSTTFYCIAASSDAILVAATVALANDVVVVVALAADVAGFFSTTVEASLASNSQTNLELFWYANWIEMPKFPSCA